jgi:DNA (cytosine-5)-methyltransferase 1
MKVVDLFCGCGGLSLGFEKAGMDIVAAFDNWIDALAVYRNNFSHPAIRADLMNIEESVKLIRPFAPDMIIGGPPCQDFSSAGKRDEDNGRGDLTVCYAKIISEIRPKWFVMENVERILKTQKLQDAFQIFKEAGYGLTYTVLNAALCGVPQRRKRFVMIGKLGAEDDFMKETLLENLSDHEMSVAEYFGDKLSIKYYYRHPRSYARRGIFRTSEPSATIRGVNRPMPKGYTLHPGDPVKSLEGIRPLTSLERSMIQTFPEDFDFEGTKTNIEQMIGNAVPVNLGYYIADAIFKYSGEIRGLGEPRKKPSKLFLFANTPSDSVLSGAL